MKGTSRKRSREEETKFSVCLPKKEIAVAASVVPPLRPRKLSGYFYYYSLLVCNLLN
jgi:hypothetical protein